MGIQVAELLDLPHVAVVNKLKIDAVTRTVGKILQGPPAEAVRELVQLLLEEEKAL